MTVLAAFLGLLAAGAGLTWLLVIRMPGRSHRGPVPVLLEAQRLLAAELERDVREIAGRIGERSGRRPASLEEAAAFVERSFRAGGLHPRRSAAAGLAGDNVWTEVAGGSLAEEIVLLGAHYDTVEGCPGANDNGTGVAALLALARRFAAARPSRTLRFVAFTGEEPPAFQTEAMGSLAFARACRAKGENILAMLSLETLGCYSDAPGSQTYPLPLLRLAYPDRGDFVAFVGNVSSRHLVREAIETFRASAPFPSQGAALPGWIPGVGWSDQWAFWQQGYPAIMVTDTAPFRYPHYHLPTDTPEKVDYQRLAQVVDGIASVVARLAR